ncbi:DUF3267 domain-containing protein [Natronorubrum aibiense]|uniref:DUF3267 domain-containing protein n=1 Tax=Natronorubrum aibiense TaxID=348826 RepID=A0A5P9P4Z1_9EURY|nr:DUF3267 domain-containing protein [Natronorubrum aibiense]QFU83225.1 DUF3267 domain-containing protein [Natronorubrum aibiense]
MSRTESPKTARLIATFRQTQAVAIQWVVVSAIGFFAFAYGFGHVLAAIRGRPLEPIIISPFAPPDVLVWLAISGVLVALVVVPHELLHGVVMAYYGAEPEYGVGVSHFVLPYAYAKTRTTSYTRNQMLAALLAPFVGITAVGLVAMVVYPSPLVLVPLAANAAGSIGDLWMAAVLLQYPADVRVAPLPDADVQGFGIYGSSDRDRRFPGARVISTVVTGAVGTLSVLSIVLVGWVLVSLAVGSGTVVIGDPNGGWLLFRHERHAHGAVHLEVGATLVLAVTTLGGLGWALVRAGYRALVAATTRS